MVLTSSGPTEPREKPWSGDVATGISFGQGTVGNGIGDIDLFVVSDELYEQGVRQGANGRNGALRVGDTRRLPDMFAIEAQISVQFAGGLKTPIRIFSVDGFNRVETGREVLN